MFWVSRVITVRHSLPPKSSKTKLLTFTCDILCLCHILALLLNCYGQLMLLFCKFLFNNVVKTYYLCTENLTVRAMSTRKRHRTVVIQVWFLEWKSWLCLHGSGPFSYQFLGPVHAETVSYHSEAFRAKTSKRKFDMSTNFKHWRLRSNFNFKFDKHELKWWRVLSSNLSNGGLFTRTSKY